MSRTNNQLPNLDKVFKDEEDQDFAPIAGSNLAAIFGAPQKLSDSPVTVKQALQKKSSSGRNTPQMVAPANKTEVIIAKVVHAYKLQNGQYSLIGKLGIALTGNVAGRVYQIILYRGKQEHISTVTLTPDFSYTIRENNYATYYDGNNENWSLCFENETACIEFAREVGVSRFHSMQTKPDNSVFYQNLCVESESNKAKENDQIEVKVIICTNLSQPLKLDSTSTQSMNVQISQYDSWERSLLNCNKGLKRLLILPPSKQISLGPGFPKEREIIVDIEIVDILRTEEKSSPPIVKPTVSSGKAAILSRMAKMGQSMLPKVPTSTTTDSEDTEEEIHIKSPRRFKPEISASHPSKHQSRAPQESSQEPTPIANVIVPRPIIPTTVPLAHRPMIPSPALTSPWPVTPIQQQYVTMDGQYYPIHQAPITQSIPVGMDPNLNVFLSETRTQNTEIRMGMSKIADNVQKLLDKFHVLEVQSASSPMSLRRPIHRSLDESMLNEERYPEDETTRSKNSGEGSYPGNSKKEQRLESELSEARERLEEYASKCKKFDLEKQEWKTEKMELVKKIDQLEKKVEEGKKALENANETVGRLQEKSNLLESSVSKLNAEKTTSSNAEQERENSMDQKSAEIKRLMRITYWGLLAQFRDEESYTSENIKETLADTIRSITFSVLKGLKYEKAEDENLETILVAQEEPPPVPPMDDDVTTQDF
ncbi:FK506-binding protein 15 isoform X2 [Venturia canescens]|uniref:FK506-binding protein 15 isoform X2 n=1 Tax=Venturia canescens TaxID=32260 RepID=UPI001C9D5BEA|nr:FK506-binding protein 15 isoform X2 [Venturia canescens]